ncbi:MAG: small multi-drug export protein [Desulfurococcaceae archaeon TW002]
MMTQLITSIFLVVLSALTPISEVRGAIPLAYLLTQDVSTRWLLVVLAVLCNSLVPFMALKILQFLENMLLSSSNRLMKIVARLYSRLMDNAREKGHKYLGKWGYLGLVVFVAIPLPLTGAWTASLIAHIFGLSRLRAALAIVIGVVIASSIVVLALEGVIAIINLLL